MTIPTWAMALRRGVFPNAALVQHFTQEKIIRGNADPHNPAAGIGIGPAIAPICQDWRSLDDYRLLLTVSGPFAPLLQSSWIELDDDVPGKGEMGNAFAKHNDKSENSTTVQSQNSEQVQRLREASVKFAASSAGHWQKLRIPIRRLNQSMRRVDLTDRALDLGTALDALLLGGAQRDITERFILRGTILLGGDEQQLINNIKLFKAIFEMRSKAVHEGRLPTPAEILPCTLTLEQIYEEGKDSCARIILKLLSDGCFPDWSKLSTGRLQQLYRTLCGKT